MLNQGLRLGVAGLCGMAANAPLQAFAQNGPNIVHIFADDLGKGSVGIHGQNARELAGLPFIATPNIDALAGDGMTFNRGYAATLCSPSRAMLMGGFHQGHNLNDRNQNIGQGFLAQDITVGEVLQDAGYTTSVWGKWGFGGSGGTQTSGAKEDDLRLNPSINSPAHALPTNQGFDEFTGYLNHSRAHRYFVSSLWTTDPTGNPQTDGISEQLLGNVGPGNSNLHALDTHTVIAQRSEQFIEDHHQDADPFYMQVNYTIPHNDLEWIEFIPGWFDAYAGQNTASWTDKEKRYAAMITYMDSTIGSLIDKLEDPNSDGDTSDSVLDNTLIIFTSDNGATNADFSTSGLNHFGINDELRGGKRDLWEGGINVPLIMRWDGQIAPGTTNDQLTDLADFMATAADLAGVRAPVGTDGISLAPTLTGEGMQRVRDYLIFEHHEGDGPDPNGLDPRWTIVRGDDKLIKFSNGELRLYNLATDPDENNQLNQGIAANAALVSELQALALAEGVENPSDYGVEFAQWTGADGDSINDGSKWSLGTAPADHWSAVVDNPLAAPSVVNASGNVMTLGFEVNGSAGQQTVIVSAGSVLEGRNAVRIAGQGRIQLDDATLKSVRWIDVLDQGELTGQGTVEGDVYNAATIAPGRADGLPALPQPKTGVNTGTVTAIDFQFVGQDVDPMTNTSALNENVELVQGFSLGGGLNFRNAADAGNEFNVTGFSGAGSDLADAIASDDYLSFTLAPVFGVEMDIESISVNLWRNGSGAAESYAILTSQDGFTDADALAQATYNDDGIANQHLLTANRTGGGTTDPVEVRIYGWGQSGNFGNTHFNDASVTASFVSVPTAALDPTGVLTLTGNYYQLDTGALAVELGGTSNADPLAPEYDQLIVTGEAQLEGTLKIALADGFVPQLGDVFEVVSAGTLAGTFDSIEGELVGNGLRAVPVYVNDSVFLMMQRAADLDADGDVDDADFGIAFAAFTGPGAGPSSNPLSDLDGDGDVDDADFGIAFASFTGPNAAANVPEPSSLALLALGGLAAMRRRR